MVTTMNRNGTGRKTFPRQPLLLAPVVLPFKGDYAGITINFDAGRVRDLLDSDRAGYTALLADLAAEETALDADETATPAAQEEQRGALWLAMAQRIITQTVHSVEWEYDDPPPDPAHVTDWPFDPAILIWIGRAGLEIAGAQFSGPLSQQARQLESWATTASLWRTLRGS